MLSIQRGVAGAVCGVVGEDRTRVKSQVCRDLPCVSPCPVARLFLPYSQYTTKLALIWFAVLVCSVVLWVAASVVGMGSLLTVAPVAWFHPEMCFASPRRRVLFMNVLDLSAACCYAAIENAHNLVSILVLEAN